MKFVSGDILKVGLGIIIGFIILTVGSLIANPSSNSTQPVEHCLDVYSGGKLIFEGKAEKHNTVSSDGSVEFTNKITNTDMLVHTDFVYYVCMEDKSQ